MAWRYLLKSFGRSDTFTVAPLSGWLGLLVLMALGGCASTQSFEGARPGMVSAGAINPAQNQVHSEAATQLWQVFDRYEGAPYHYGGMSAAGFDCSGFIVTAYREALGRQLPRTTSQMLARGQEVRPEDLQPGDLLFFHISGKDQHAGIYMGDYQFIHASSSSGVIDSSLMNEYWRAHYSQARRF